MEARGGLWGYLYAGSPFESALMNYKTTRTPYVIGCNKNIRKNESIKEGEGVKVQWGKGMKEVFERMKTLRCFSHRDMGGKCSFFFVVTLIELMVFGGICRLCVCAMEREN